MTDHLDLNTLLATPYLTSDLPGIGGKIRSTMEDFLVDEVPLYLPCGEGEHLYLKVKKSGLNTQDVVKELAQMFNIHPKDFGVAGQKDKYAITQQWISLPFRGTGLETTEEATNIKAEGFEILEAHLHANKLKMGHLKANRFEITIRTDTPEGPERIKPLLDAIRAKGIPNYYGQQRFGNRNNTFIMGWNALVKSEIAPPLRKNSKLKRFALNSVQSAIFNRVLAERVLGDELHQAVRGDILEKKEGGLLRVDGENLEEASGYVQNGEMSPTGPMVGSRMLEPNDEVRSREATAQADFEVEDSHLEAYRSLLRGERRVLRIVPEELELLEANAEFIRIGFLLPSGAYATVLLRELMKADTY